MRYIDHSLVPMPVGAPKENKIWDDLTPLDRRDIRNALVNLQKQICAYCEVRIDLDNSSVEHFRPKKLYKHLTFVWENLFACCTKSFNAPCCEDKKGSRDTKDAISPAEKGCENFFQYLSNGKITPSYKISDHDKKRAENTISLLGLNRPNLVNRRKSIYRALVAQIPYLDDEQAGYFWTKELDDEGDCLPEFFSMKSQLYLDTNNG